DNIRGFIHESERDIEPRLGETIEGRVIEVKPDGTLNVSLHPLKEDRIESDADIILAYLKINDGKMPYNDKSNPDDIKDVFGMRDRKSTRLNSSHVSISYAVFCLKKRNKNT